MKRKLYFLFIGILMIVLDQWSKLWIVNNLKGKPEIVWIKNVFELYYVENRGAAFSSFTGKQTFLLTVTVIVLAFLVFEYVRIPDNRRFNWLHFAFVMLMAGAVGNMIDRLRQGYVVDFFYFMPIDFPCFNVADIFVTCSVPLFVILVFFVYKDKETEFLFSFKKK